MKPGYKQTEVGVIPEDWGISTVGNEFDVRLGKMLDAEKNVGEPKPYIGNSNVQWDSINVGELPSMRMTQEDLQQFRLHQGDLLVCEGGEVGRAVIWDAPIEECYYQKALHRLRPRRGFDSRLMVGFLRLWSWRGDLNNYVTQTSIAHLPREKLIKVPLPVPPLHEQSAIASALGDMDALLDGLDRLIAKKRAIKQAAMQQLLTGQTRLPGFSGEWEIKRLDNVAAIKKGDLITTNTLVEGEIPVIAGGKQAAYFHATANRSGKTITISASGASAGYVAFHDYPIFASDCSTISESIEYNINFLFYILALQQQKIYAAQTGGAQPHIQPKDLAPIPIDFPVEVREQTAIAQALGDMDAEIAALEARHAKTHALKQAMMQELLTGNTRLI